MKFVFALLFLIALAVQNSSAFVVGGRSLHLKRGPFGPLKMGAPSGSVSYTLISLHIITQLSFYL